MTFRRFLMRSTRLGLTALFLVVLLLYGVGAAYELSTEQVEAARFRPVGQLYDIGGRKLHLYCLGQPEPNQAPVILVSGAAESLYTWWNLQHQLAASGQACSYDRSGYGWSEVTPGSRPAAVLAGELQALLHAAGLQPPYILVGHALGGFVVRQYALDFPAEVQGLVLVDSLDAESIARLPALVRKPLLMIPAIESGVGAVLQTAGVLRLLDRWNSLQTSVILTSLPDDVAPAAKAVYFNPRRLATAAREQAAVPATAMNMVERQLPQDLPIIALLASPTSGQRLSPDITRDFENLTSNTQVRQLPETGGNLHLSAASQVLQAIWEIQKPSR